MPYGEILLGAIHISWKKTLENMTVLLYMYIHVSHFYLILYNIITESKVVHKYSILFFKGLNCDFYINLFPVFPK